MELTINRSAESKEKELTAARKKSDALINAERARRILAGTTVKVSGYDTPIRLQGREEDKSSLLGLVTAAQMRIAQGDTVYLTKFRDMENVDHDLTPPQVVEMWSLGSEWISAVYQASWRIKAMVPPPENFADDELWK